MPYFAFDCEGPLTLNDNAFEFTAFLIPQGERFFTQISRFDDYLADLKKRPGYKAGDTLKLILPFLKLFGATNKMLKDFSERTLLLLPGVEEVLPELNQKAKTFIISTSYKPYLEALAKRLNFPLEQIFCTEVDFDKVSLTRAERETLQKLFEEILKYPLLEFPREAKTPEDLPPQLLKLLDRLEEIFFEIIYNLDCGVFLREVNPIGGEEKARACETISQELSLSHSEGFYCGDSITDCQALKLLREAGGVSLSFNGNRYALREAEFYALSSKAYPLKELAELFLQGGKEALKTLQKDLEEGYEFSVVPTNEEAFQVLVGRSEAFRKKVRGELIGALG